MPRNDAHAGRVVVVTGGSGGIGLPTAIEFARAGARLAICARDEERLRAARKAVLAEGAECLALPVDVRDQEQVGELVETVLAEYGRIDVLVNIAGGMFSAALVSVVR
jgi:NADP-dependent 3-hydroxy acid dehydrogenase YdfG